MPTCDDCRTREAKDDTGLCVPCGLARKRAAAVAAFVEDMLERVLTAEREHRANAGEIARLKDRLTRIEDFLRPHIANGAPHPPESEAVALLRRWLNWSSNTGQRGAYGIGPICEDTRRHLATADNPCPGARHVAVDDGGQRGRPEIETTRSES